jgi:hypothetical protein
MGNDDGKKNEQKRRKNEGGLDGGSPSHAFANPASRCLLSMGSWVAEQSMIRAALN